MDLYDLWLLQQAADYMCGAGDDDDSDDDYDSEF